MRSRGRSATPHRRARTGQRTARDRLCPHHGRRVRILIRSAPVDSRETAVAAGPASEVLAGRVAIVTGASSGIGAACAAELVRGGAHVLWTGRHEARLREHAAGCDGPGDSEVIAADLTQDGACERVVE